MTRPLRIVAPVEADRVDLYARWKADIAARDWDRVHVVADRGSPVDIADRLKRTWAR
jgi:hypothetical protein